MSILYNRHTYTVTFDLYFVIDYMPEVKADFAKQIIAIMEKHNAIAFINGVALENDELLCDSHNLCSLDEWEFKKKNDTSCLAPKKQF